MNGALRCCFQTHALSTSCPCFLQLVSTAVWRLSTLRAPTVMRWDLFVYSCSVLGSRLRFDLEDWLFFYCCSCAQISSWLKRNRSCWARKEFLCPATFHSPRSDCWNADRTSDLLTKSLNFSLPVRQTQQFASEESIFRNLLHHQQQQQLCATHSVKHFELTEWFTKPRWWLMTVLN